WPPRKRRRGACRQAEKRLPPPRERSRPWPLVTHWPESTTRAGPEDSPAPGRLVSLPSRNSLIAAAIRATPVPKEHHRIPGPHPARAQGHDLNWGNLAMDKDSAARRAPIHKDKFPPHLRPREPKPAKPAHDERSSPVESTAFQVWRDYIYSSEGREI